MDGHTVVRCGIAAAVVGDLVTREPELAAFAAVLDELERRGLMARAEYVGAGGVCVRLAAASAPQPQPETDEDRAALADALTYGAS